MKGVGSGINILLQAQIHAVVVLLEPRVKLELGQLEGKHFFEDHLRSDFDHPAKLSLGLGRVSEKGFNFGGTEVEGSVWMMETSESTEYSPSQE